LYELLGKEKDRLTDNGIHLTAWGYWRSATILERALGLPETSPRVEEWKKLIEVDKNPGPIQATIDILPFPPPPKEGRPPDFRWQSTLVKVEGIRLSLDLDYARAEVLRQAIAAKNRLYFYRWRPENETYLFGFRKHEQGQNAREIPQFDPLIAEKEKEIAKLRDPVPHTYELKVEKKP
jgi:hypothetical protein